MATKMLMPLLGQTMEEGTIIKWFKNEGDSIKAGEPLLEVMTDKVNMEVEAPESGVLRKIYSPVDAIVPVKDPICIIGSADESIDSLLAEGAPVEAAPASTPTVEAPTVAVAETAAPAVAVSMERVFASPAARRVARERGIDVELLAGKGTGPGGRIVEKDVLDFIATGPSTTPLAGKMAADMGVAISGIKGTGVGGKITSDDISAASTPAAPAYTPPAMGYTIPYAGMRKAVGQNVSLSAQTAPHVTLVSEIDMTECTAMRKSILADVEKNFGVRISFTDIIVKACARAIQDKPLANASLVGDQIIVHSDINVGIATAIEGALVVPVVKNVPGKPLHVISQEIKELAARARSGQASGDDFKGGTFTISNLGVYGIDSFNPIITPGQSTILGVCRIADKPVVVNGEIKIRPMMNLCLSFDHRILDGAPAAEFLARLRDILESPYLIFA
jgi:pyruvate dehydrogenase E2 component (dihydrolipoamide acetyltransferase)